MAYLGRVHFELPYHLDRDLVVDVLGVLGPIDITEGAVAHLLDQLPAFEARISRELAFAFTLFGNDALENRRVIIFLFLVSLGLGVYGTGGGMTGLCGNISIVDGGCREVVLLWCCCL